MTVTIERVSVANDETQGINDSNVFSAGKQSVSDDGRYIAFFSFAPNLVSGDSNGTWDVFVRDVLSPTSGSARHQQRISP